MSVFDRAVGASEGYIGKALAVLALKSAATRIGKSAETLVEGDTEAFIAAFSESLAPVTSKEVLAQIATEVREAGR